MKEYSDILKPNRPEPVDHVLEPFAVSKKSPFEPAVNKLIKRKFVLIEDEFSTGLKLLAELKLHVFKGEKKEDFTAYRNKRTDYHLSSNNLLVPIKENKIDLRKAPDIGWLEKLYPDIENFLLPFPQVQGLNSSWQWYVKGIQYPGLNNKIHPFYGTYFPTRYDHLYLFDYWLKKYSGPRKTALDLGTGCGVLAFQLLNRGIEKVYATDINPNSVISVLESAKYLGVEEKLVVSQSNLFENISYITDLLVFNPPWLPSPNKIEGLDKAIYYQPGFFEQFFEEAGNYVHDGGKIVLLFSNLAQTTGIQQNHPVEDELNNHQRYKKVKRITRKVSKPSSKTKRRDHRTDEYVELWELEIR